MGSGGKIMKALEDKALQFKPRITQELAAYFLHSEA
jgi:hypothetical protein